jgi:hypothetical protein
MKKLMFWIRKKYNTIKMKDSKLDEPENFSIKDAICIFVETQNGQKIFTGFRKYEFLPQRNDVIGYKGKNYKIIYRKFVFVLGNKQVGEIKIVVKEIDGKF